MSKYNVLDLFCGCGGLSKGFELSGFNIVGGIDFDQAAISTFNNNFPNANSLCCDISSLAEKEISKFLLNIENIDVIIGGPPCQGFSSANRYQKENTSDSRNKLFFEFVKFVDKFNPRIVVIENVKGIVTQNNGYTKKEISKIFEKRGYFVTNEILKASDYGVPQNRARNFFVMTKDKKFDFNRLKKSSKKITVKDAIGELYDFEKNEAGKKTFLEKAPNSQYRKYLRNKDGYVYNHEVRYPAEIRQKRISFVPQGGNWQNIPKDLFPTQRGNRHSSAYKRLNEEDVSVTIDTGNSHSNYFHPIFNRIPTVREAARLQSFPDNFIFDGTRTAQYRQVGNAVPPLMAKALADCLMEVLNEK